VYVKDTKDNNIVKIVKSTINLEEPWKEFKSAAQKGQRKLSEF
jgi:hypothetical protein